MGYEVVCMRYSFHDAPIRVFGAPQFNKTGTLERLPEEVRCQVPSLEFLGRRCNGARVAFRTDSPTVGVTVEYETLSMDVGMSLYQCQGSYVYFGRGAESRYAGLVVPRRYDVREAGNTFTKGAEMEDVMIYLPRNEIITAVYIDLADDAHIEAPTPYMHGVPVVYYGSSITEGAFACKTSCTYESYISRWLDVDHINLGFSGSAKGELPIADYINTLDMSVLVMDYDYNAPNPEHLAATHEPFFQRIREAHPNLPVIFVSRPVYEAEDTDADKRREIIRRTWQNAVDAGDTKVAFVDGGQFFEGLDPSDCTNDNVHPNDLGMYCMAEAIAPVVEEFLKK